MGLPALVVTSGHPRPKLVMATTPLWVALALGGVTTLSPSTLYGRNGVGGLIMPPSAKVGHGHVVVVGGADGGIMAPSSLHGQNGVDGLIRPPSAKVGHGHNVIVGGAGGGRGITTPLSIYGRNGVDGLIRSPLAEVGDGHDVINAMSTHQHWPQYAMAMSLPWAESWQPLILIGLCSLLLGLPRLLFRHK